VRDGFYDGVGFSPVIGMVFMTRTGDGTKGTAQAIRELARHPAEFDFRAAKIGL